jgi:hypothetical protein
MIRPAGGVNAGHCRVCNAQSHVCFRPRVPYRRDAKKNDQFTVTTAQRRNRDALTTQRAEAAKALAALQVESAGGAAPQTYGR